MCTKILMLGNGFDLANGLPTTYKDFLEFCKYASAIYEDDSLNPAPFEKDYENKYVSKWSFNDHIKQKLIELFHSKHSVGSIFRTKSNDLNELYDCINNNTFYLYFQSCLENNTLKGVNWIDFESEIAAVLHEIERLIEYKKNTQEELSSTNFDLKILEFYNRFETKQFVELTNPKNRFSPTRTMSINTRTVSQIEYNEIEHFINDLLDDLNKITRALEIYLSVFVSILTPKKISDFEGILFNHILSFNYTQTFSHHYNDNLADEYDVCYVHGEASKVSSIKTCNLVLGINEYLPDDRKNVDLIFLAFKKYYQRIFKQTNNQYSIWIDDIVAETIDCHGNNVRIDEFELHIFGHSLDITDKDILRAFILNDNVHTKIYYYRTADDDKRDFSAKIKNLIGIIGQDELIARTGGGSKNTIEFIPQNI